MRIVQHQKKYGSMEKDRFYVQEQFALEMKDEAMWNCMRRAQVVVGAGMSTKAVGPFSEVRWRRRKRLMTSI
jgi:hypothetical protein